MKTKTNVTSGQVLSARGDDGKTYNVTVNAPGGGNSMLDFQLAG